MAGTQRYWDGAEWTDHVAPGAPQQPPARDVSDGLLVAGWITAFIVPVIGFIIGCVLLPKRTGQGVGMMLVAIVAAYFWFDALTPNDPFSR
jgi:hypothetical protein